MPIDLFDLKNGKVVTKRYEHGNDMATHFLWYDLFDPTQEEENWVDSTTTD